MGIKYKLIPSIHVCINKYDREFNTLDAILFANKQFLDKDYLKIKYLIADFRNATSSFNEDEMNKITSIVLPKEFQKNIKKMALIAKTPELYVSNYFFKEKVSHLIDAEIDLFSTLKGALYFLELENYHKIILENIEDMEV